MSTIVWFILEHPKNLFNAYLKCKFNWISGFAFARSADSILGTTLTKLAGPLAF